MNIAIYLRVSTEDQSNDAQRIEVTEHCARQGWLIVAEYTDTISGSKAARPGLDSLLAHVDRGGIQAIAVVKLDRLGRSLLNVTALMERLREKGVAVICTSQGIDTRADSPCGTMIWGIMAAFAQFERALIRERTVAGLRAVKAKGVILGRPSPTLIPEPARSAAIEAWKANNRKGGLRGLAHSLSCKSAATAMKLLRSHEASVSLE